MKIFIVFLKFKAVESLSASSSEEQEVTKIEKSKHTQVNYTKEEYIESTVRETKEIHHHVEASLDDFLVSFF